MDNINMPITKDKILSFKMLKENWDSYDAQPLTADALERAIETVDFIKKHFADIDDAYLATCVSPCTTNCIIFEFVYEGREILIS